MLFKVQLPAKAGVPAKEESFILTVGERQGEIEVLAINPKAGTVTMKNYGVVTNLSLELNSDKLVSVAPVTLPGPMAAPLPMTAPGAVAPPPMLPTLPGGRFPRTLRLPGANSTQPDPGQQGGANFGGYGVGSANQQKQAEIPLDNQILNMAAQILRAQLKGDPVANIIPLPHDLANEFEQAPSPTQPAAQ